MNETGIQPAPPPGAFQASPVSNGATVANFPPASDEPADSRGRTARSPLVKCLDVLASLRITTVLFVLAFILVYYGTWAQVDSGLWTVVKRYFRSWIVMIPLRTLLMQNHNPDFNPPISLPFPGGWTIGTAILINLIASHIARFRYTWKRAGIWILHAGLILMMIGELIYGVYAEEGAMIIMEGQKTNVVHHTQSAELAIIRPELTEDAVVTVPASMLRTSKPIVDPKLPFEIEAIEYHVNSDIRGREVGDEAPATKGQGLELKLVPLSEGAGADTDSKVDYPAAYVRVKKDGKEIGVFLVSPHLNDPDWVTVDGVVYQLSLRFKQTFRDFSFFLEKFHHDFHANTEKAKNFKSDILVSREGGEAWQTSIYMNHPLRYEGETFYQASWIPDRTDRAGRRALGTQLQVVRNPGWLLPYYSFGMVCLGMGFHFVLQLSSYINKRIKETRP